MDSFGGLAGAWILFFLLLVRWAGSTAETLGPFGSSSKIDVHAHYYPPFYPDLYIEYGITLATGYLPPAWNVTHHLEVNELIGVAKSVLSISTPGAKFFKEQPDDVGRQLARRLNEELSNVTAEYPDKFMFFATLTLPDVEGAVAEAIYALDTLKAVGVYLEASKFGVILGSPLYVPLYKVLDDRRATVFVHPSDFPCPSCDNENDYGDVKKVHPFVAEFLMDTTRAAANLVFHNVTREYPNIKFILAHSGGYLPFSAGRMASGLCILAGEKPDKIPSYVMELKKFYVEVAGSATPFALPSTTALFDSSHILFGTDYPLSPVPLILQNTKGLRGVQTNADCDGGGPFLNEFLTPQLFATV